MYTSRRQGFKVIGKKILYVSLKGFLSTTSKIEEMKVVLNQDATLADLIEHIKNTLGFDNLYDDRIRHNQFVIFINNCHIECDKWQLYIPSNYSSILVIPRFSDG